MMTDKPDWFGSKHTITKPIPVEPKQYYLTVHIGKTACAFLISRVHEVLPCCPITRLPQSAATVKGLVNLHGRGVPVVDLHIKFALEPCVLTKYASMIVLESVQEPDFSPVLFVVLVDAVHEVVEWADSSLLPKPKFGSTIPLDFVENLAQDDKQVYSILSVDKIFSPPKVIRPSFSPKSPTTIKPGYLHLVNYNKIEKVV